jgi:hypothetical protein
MHDHMNVKFQNVARRLLLCQMHVKLPCEWWDLSAVPAVLNVLVRIKLKYNQQYTGGRSVTPDSSPQVFFSSSNIQTGSSY